LVKNFLNLGPVTKAFNFTGNTFGYFTTHFLTIWCGQGAITLGMFPDWFGDLFFYSRNLPLIGEVWGPKNWGPKGFSNPSSYRRLPPPRILFAKVNTCFSPQEYLKRGEVTRVEPGLAGFYASISPCSGIKSFPANIWNTTLEKRVSP